MSRLSSHGVRAAVATLAIVAALAAASGCGGSSSSADTAKKNACNAKSDINAQVTKLKGLPASLSSLDTAKTALQQIQKDLGTIQDSLPDVTGDLKDQLKAANSAFSSQVKQVTQDITSAQSLTDAAGTLTTAGQTLAEQYQQAFAGVKC
jgi:chromosome segregation ATPase